MNPYSQEEHEYIKKELDKYDTDLIYPPPKELQEQRNWILWGVKIQRDSDKKFVCLVDKVPFSYNGMTFHPHVDTYTSNGKTFKNPDIKKFTFDEIKQIYINHKSSINKYGKVLGIGYHFQNSKYSGIDLDKIHSPTGENIIMPVFKKLLKLVESKGFIEQSKSGNGCHVYIKIDEKLGNHKFKFKDLTMSNKYKKGLHDSSGIDYFEDDLYFIYTGRQVEGFRSSKVIDFTTSDYKKVNDFFKRCSEEKSISIVKKKVDYSISNNDKGVVTSNLLEYMYQNVSMKEVVNRLGLNLECNGRLRQECPLSGHNTKKKRLKYLDKKDIFYCYGEHEKVTIMDLYREVYNTRDNMQVFRQIDSDFNLGINFKASYKEYCNRTK